MTEYTKEQQAENRAKWVAALRSGEFKQTKNELKNSEGHCCLGVACELAVQAGVAREVRAGLFRGTDETTSSHTSALPTAVKQWLGLDSPFGRLVDRLGDLTILNDDGGYTFAQIADVIESGNVRLAE
jgi:hypothetical protein